MGKIKTNNGVLHYRMVPLYPGVKIIDKAKSTENLLLLKAVLDRQQIPFLLIAGTLLGAVREGDFIAHDEDIDLAFLAEDKQRVLDALPAMIETGFAIARYNRRGVLSVIRQGEYIDLYFFAPYAANQRACDGWIVLEQFLIDTAPYEFKGASFLAPREYREYLLCEYGADWQTPIAWNNYKMPKWRITLLKIKEYIKEIMPDRLYFYLARRSERRHEERCKIRFERYFARKQKKENE